MCTQKWIASLVNEHKLPNCCLLLEAVHGLSATRYKGTKVQGTKATCAAGKSKLGSGQEVHHEGLRVADIAWSSIKKITHLTVDEDEAESVADAGLEESLNGNP